MIVLPDLVMLVLVGGTSQGLVPSSVISWHQNNDGICKCLSYV